MESSSYRETNYTKFLTEIQGISIDGGSSYRESTLTKILSQQHTFHITL